MNHHLFLQSSRFDSTGKRFARCVTLWVAGLVTSQHLVRAEEMLPLVTNAILPASGSPAVGDKPDPVLGFPGLPEDSAGTPPDDGLQPLPGDPGLSFDALTEPGEFMGPFAAVEPSLVANPQSPESVPPVSDPAPAGTSGSGDFSTNPGGIPGFRGGLPSSPGINGGWTSGFSGIPGAFATGDPLTETLLDGLGLSASLTGTYDTNPSQGYGPAEDSGQGDFFLTLGGAVSYLSRASTWTYGASYSGGYSQYFNQSDLSGYSQSAGGTVNYDGGPLSATFNLGINFGSGANRYYASVVDEISYNYGLSARYRISRKTSLTGDLSQRFTSASGDGNSDTDSFDLGAAALWRYSPLTEFGPGIRYTSDSGHSGQDRTSIGPTLTVNYELSKKVSLNSRVGMDFAEYGDGETADPALSMSIGLNYRASRLWGMNLALMRDTQASYAAAGEFEELTSLRLGYNRKIRRAVWNLGMGLETRSTENPDNTEPERADRDYLTFDTSLGMPVFADTCSASVFMRYSDQDGAAEESWDSLQTGFSISRSF